MVDLDQSSTSRSRPDPSGIDNPRNAASNPTNTAAASSLPSTTPSQTQRPSTRSSTNSTVSQISSNSQSPPTATSATNQILGRRRRSSRSQPSEQTTPGPEQGSAAAESTSDDRNPKRRRRGGSEMLAEVSAAPSNGVAVAHANGNGATAATNGTKAALVVNGSKLATQNGSEKASTYFGHNREEVTRIMIQALSGMGYQQAAELVSRDSGFDLESPTVAAFRTAVLDGQWADAEALLGGAALPGGHASEGNGLVLAAGADRDTMRFWLRQQKFLELLETQSSSKALLVLRTELTPLGQDTHKLHFLSSLLMCASPQDLKAKANWDGADGESRKELLSDLSR